MSPVMRAKGTSQNHKLMEWRSLISKLRIDTYNLCTWKKKNLKSAIVYFSKSFISLHLCMCVEQLKQCDDKLLHTDVPVPVLVQVVAHGVSLGFCQQVARLLFQHGSWLVHQTGKCHLRACHSFIKDRLRERYKTRWNKRMKQMYLSNVLNYGWRSQIFHCHLRVYQLTGSGGISESGWVGGCWSPI